jgi:hypothetical protein
LKNSSSQKKLIGWDEILEGGLARSNCNELRGTKGGIEMT